MARYPIRLSVKHQYMRRPGDCQCSRIEYSARSIQTSRGARKHRLAISRSLVMSPF